MNDDEDIERAAIMQFDGGIPADLVEKLSQTVGKKLRPYQETGIEQLRDKIREGKKRIIFYLPTGGGKTEVAAAITRTATEKGKRAAFVCNRIELVRQASARFNADGLHHGILQGTNSRGEWNPLMICSIQTIARRTVADFDLLIVDEAHACAGTKAYHRLFEQFSTVPIIGLTATPFSKGLAKHYPSLNGPLFEDIVIAATIPELIRDGYLVECDIYGPSEPDLSRVKIVAGEYHQGQLDEAVDKAELIGDIVTHWLKLGGNQPTICFATNIAHSQHIQKQFRDVGVGCQHIDCYTEDHDRKKIIDGFKRGDFKILTNVSVLAEGFDAPKAAVMILARPTKSLVRYIQMAGRVLRPADGKTRAMMLDHSGTAKRLGFPTDELPLELDDGKPPEAGKAAKPDPPLPKPCPSCHFLKKPREHTCPMCGFAPQRQSDVMVGAGELRKMARAKMTQDQKAEAFAELKHYAIHKGYNQGWASHKFREMTGVWPNNYRHVAPKPPSQATLDWIKSRVIAFAKARQAV